MKSFDYVYMNCANPHTIWYERMTLQLHCAFDVTTDYLSEW